MSKGTVYLFGTGVNDPSDFSRARDWRDHRTEWVALFGNLEKLGVRGPISKALLEQAGASNVEVVGDPAVLLHKPLPDSAGAARTFRASRPTRIAINIGVTSFPLLQTVRGAIELLVRAIPVLIREGIETEIFTVWPPDIQAAEYLSHQIGLRGKQICCLGCASEAMKYLDMWDIVISFKLHAGILAFARNVPVIMLDYSSKCKDFAQSIGWNRYIIRPEEPDAGRLIEMVEDIRRTQPVLRNYISEVMTLLKDRFTEYCRFLKGRLADPYCE